MSNRIYIIGMGPGREEMMTGEAIAALEQVDVIVGYTVYVKLLGERFAGKKLLTTSMRQETERCELCFREAEAGNQVALICSGDAGIYGLASLMYELGAKHPETELLVIPGITAASSGAAVLGAPLNHDFCVISLVTKDFPNPVIFRKNGGDNAQFVGFVGIVLLSAASKSADEHQKRKQQRSYFFIGFVTSRS